MPIIPYATLYNISLHTMYNVYTIHSYFNKLILSLKKFSICFLNMLVKG